MRRCFLVRTHFWLLLFAITLPEAHGAGGPGNALIFHHGSFESYVSVPHNVERRHQSGWGWKRARSRLPDMAKQCVANERTVPTAPTNLIATVAGNTVTFRWSAANDAQTPSGALTYNLRVGTLPGGSDVVAPMAAPNGLRRLPQMGNAGQNPFRTMALPIGPLYWSVQAVDGGFAGGPFSAEAFVFLRPSLTISRTPGGVLLSWPVSAGDYTLQATPGLVGNPPLWVSVPPPYGTNGNRISISNSAAGASHYYRLRRP